jgi:hypothetical protein
MQDGRLLCLAAADSPDTEPLEELLPLERRLPKLELEPEPGLIGYWKLDEGEGPLARDSSGNGLDAEADERWVRADGGTCLATQGRPAALTIPDSPALHFGTGDFSIALWVKLQSYNCRLLGKNQFPQTWWVINVLADGRSELVLGAGRNRSVRARSSRTLGLGQWIHLAYAVDRRAGEVRCYLDGRPDSTIKLPESFTYRFDVPGRPLLIPSRYKPFRGYFDEVRLYRRALTEQAVELIYRRGRTGSK